MSHEIYNVGNKNPIAYVGETPWHGLGQKLSENAPIEVWRTEAGLDWQINNSPVTFLDSLGETHTIDDRKVLYRSDDLSSLAVVSNRYKVVQPEEILEFYRDLTESHGYSLETAGVLKHGKKIWALAKTGMGTTLAGGDEIGAYLLLATACDGTMATTAQFTSVRVVCQNTLNMSLAQARGIKVRHSTTFDADKVKNELGIVRNEWDTFGDIIQEMSKRKVGTKEVSEIIFDLFKAENTNSIEEESTKNKNIMREVMQSVARSPGSSMESANGTAWGLLNGITYHVDHKMGSRTTDNRLDSAWFGAGQTLKNQAFERISRLVDAETPEHDIHECLPGLKA